MGRGRHPEKELVIFHGIRGQVCSRYWAHAGSGTRAETCTFLSSSLCFSLGTLSFSAQSCTRETVTPVWRDTSCCSILITLLTNVLLSQVRMPKTESHCPAWSEFTSGQRGVLCGVNRAPFVGGQEKNHQSLGKGSQGFSLGT